MNSVSGSPGEGECPAKVGQLVQEIFACRERRTPAAEETLQNIRQGIAEGWLEPIDEFQSESCLEKRTAARIVHRFLRVVLKEQDEDDWGTAKDLRDLYDCRTCVNHVAQVYCKGIIQGEEAGGISVFGMRSLLTEVQVKGIVARVFAPVLRRGMNSEPGEAAECVLAEHISQVEAKGLLNVYRREETGFLLLDVRSSAEYEKGHLRGAASMPMTEALENPELLGENREIPILVYCDLGYRSELVADFLRHRGFVNVYYFEVPKWDSYVEI